MENSASTELSPYVRSLNTWSLLLHIFQTNLLFRGKDPEFNKVYRSVTFTFKNKWFVTSLLEWSQLPGAGVQIHLQIHWALLTSHHLDTCASILGNLPQGAYGPTSFHSPQLFKFVPKYSTTWSLSYIFLALSRIINSSIYPSKASNIYGISTICQALC